LLPILLLRLGWKDFSNITVYAPVTNITGVPTTATVNTPLTLTGTVVPSNATNQNITWSVQNAGTTGATISGNILNTTAGGTVTVRATIINGLTATTNYTQDFNITVFVPVTNITGVPTTATVNTPLTLTGTVVPSTATNQTINWSVQSAGTTGATISGNTLNTTAAGTVTVRATIINGLTATTNYTQDFNITIIVPVTNITGVPTTATAGTPLTLTGTVVPSNATNQNITWSVQNAGITGATISGNTLNTTAAGTVTVRATITNGLATTNYTQDFNITVSAVCGDGLTYTLTGTGGNLTLIISKTGTGTGAMYNYPSGGAHWYGQRANIRTLVMQTGVASIGNNAFYNCDALTSATIPNTVTTIGNSAFNSCILLESITIPSSVTTIGDYAFQICRSLTAINVDAGNSNFSSDSGVLFNKGKTTLFLYPQKKTGIVYTIPNSVATIGDYAFQGCEGLTSVNIPNSVATIGNYAFNNCRGLMSVNIPNTVVSIGHSAFLSCNVLESITIPASVTTIGDYAFSSCNALTSVTNQRSTPQVINANVFSAATYTNATLYVPAAALSAYSAPTATGWKDFTNKMVIPSYVPVTNIIGVPTTNTTSTTLTLTGTVVPSNATNQNITWSVQNAGTTEASIIGDVLYTNLKGTVTVRATIINGLTESSNYTQDFDITAIAAGPCGDGLTYLISGTEPNLTLTITYSGTGTGVMDNYINYPGGRSSWYPYRTNIKTLVFNGNVTTIGDYAFSNCSGLTSVTIPASVTSIGVAAFNGCSGLISATIPSSTTTIGNSAFAGCNALTSVTNQCATPQVINVNVFTTAAYANATLYVPSAAAVTAYSAATATGWKDFSHIVAYFVPVTDITGVPTTATAGTSLILTGTVVPSNATNQTITWSVQDAGTTGATISGNTLNTTAAGTVTVEATIIDGTAVGLEYTQEFNITVTTTGIDDIFANSIIIYPNPAKDELFIDIPSFENLEYLKNVEICDLAGRTVGALRATPLQGNATINVSALPQGIYLVKIYTDKGVVTKKFVKN